MPEFEAAAYQGFLVQDSRITSLSVTDSSYTQAGPLPGVPVPGVNTDLTLIASGSQAANAQLDVVATRGGFPGRGTGCGVVWKQGADTLYRGWESPIIITGWEAVSWTTTTVINRNLFVFTQRGIEGLGGTNQDRVLIASSGVSGGVVTTRLRRRTVDGTVSGALSIHSEAASGTSTSCPAMLQLPNGRMLLFLVSWDTDAATFNVRMHYDDGGGTWPLGASAVLPADISTATTTPQRLRVAYHNGEILLLLQLKDTAVTYQDLVVQYASDDLGVSFAEVFAQDGESAAQSWGYPDVTVVDDAFVVCYVAKADQLGYCRRIGSAWQPLSSVSEVVVFPSVVGTVAANVFSQGDMAVVADDRGVLRAFGVYPDTNNSYGRMARSNDGGVSWGAASAAARWWTNTDDGGHAYPNRFSCCWQRGRVIMAHNWSAANGNEDDSLGLLYLGGFSTTTLPKGADDGPGTIGIWSNTWLPIEEPADLDNSYWAPDGTGTVDLVSPGVLSITTSSNHYYVTHGSITSGVSLGIGAEFVFARAAGVASVRVIVADGTNDYDVEIYKDGGGDITIVDNNAGPATLATYTAADATLHTVRVAVSEDGVSVDVRADDTNEDREWVSVLSGEALTSDTGSPAAASSIRWGTDASTANHDVTFKRFCWGQARENAGGKTNPDDLVPCPISTAPTYIDGGLYLSAADGPAFQGDTWTVATRYSYPATNLLITESPSPARVWRATGTADATFAFDLGVNQNSQPESGLIGIYLEGCNASQITIGLKGGTYSDVDNGALTTTVVFSRGGSTVFLTSCTSGGFYLQENELAGLDFALSTTVARRIVSNTGGWVPPSTGNATTHRLPRLTLADVDHGSDPSSGSGYLFWSRVLALLSATYNYEGISVRLGKHASRPAPTSGYFTAGTMVVGPVAVWGQPYTAQRVITHVPNVDLFEATDGTTRSRRRGKTRRLYSMNWEQNDERALFSDGDAYVLASDQASVRALAMQHDAFRMTLGLIARQDGPREPFVLIPKMPHLTASLTVIGMPKRDAPVLVRAVGDLQESNDLGNETGEELLGFGLTCREEV